MRPNITDLHYRQYCIVGFVMAMVMGVTVATTSFGLAFQELIAHQFYGSELYVVLGEISIALSFVPLMFLSGLMRKYSPKTIVIWQVFSMAGCILLFALMREHEFSYVFPTLVLALIHMFYPVTTTILHHNLPDSVRSTFQGIYNVFFGLSLTVSPALIRHFYAHMDMLYLFTTGLCLLFIVPAAFLKQEFFAAPQAEVAQGKNVKTKNHWYNNFSIVNSNPLMYVIVTAVSANGALAMLIVFFGKSYHVDMMAVDHMMEIFMLGGVILSIPVGVIADKFGIVRSFMSMIVLALLTSGIFALSNGDVVPNELALFFFGGAQSCLYMLMFSYLGRIFKGADLVPANAGTASYMLFAKLLFIQLYGWLLDSYSHYGLMRFIFSLNALVLLIMVFMINDQDKTAA